MKHLPNKPGSLHINGEIERVQCTILYEFHSSIDHIDPNRKIRLSNGFFNITQHVQGPLGEADGKVG